MEHKSFTWRVKSYFSMYFCVPVLFIFHIIILPAYEIADTRYYRAWVGVGKRETLYLS